MDGKLYASYHRRQRTSTHVKDEVIHIKGAVYTRGQGSSYIVNCQREEQNTHDAALGNALPLEKGVREIGFNPNSEGTISKKVLNKDGKITPQV